MIKETRTLLFDERSATKKKGRYKMEKEANNPALSKNGFVPGGDASRADVPFQLPPRLGPATLPWTKTSS